MKARLAFYFAVAVALVLFLAAAIPSHATQHRDPALTQDAAPKSQPAPAAKPHADAKGTSAVGPESKDRTAGKKTRKNPEPTSHSAAKPAK